MAANETTKFQINYKLSDGTLINLYAKDVKDLETGLTDLSMVSALIKSTASELTGGSATAAAVSAITSQFPAAEPVSVQSNGQPHQCRHGVMSYREGVGQKGPWKGWMCAAPKGAPDKCDTIWVR